MISSAEEKDPVFLTCGLSKQRSVHLNTLERGKTKARIPNWEFCNPAKLSFRNKEEMKTSWPASWETCMQVRKQQLEVDMEQQTGSN